MNERELLRKLLAQRHLSVPDMKKLLEWRKANGRLLCEIILESLEKHRCYPERGPDLEGELFGIVQAGTDFHVYFWDEVRMSQVAMWCHQVYTDPRMATLSYLQQTFHDEIDGVTIDWSNVDTQLVKPALELRRGERYRARKKLTTNTGEIINPGADFKFLEEAYVRKDQATLFLFESSGGDVWLWQGSIRKLFDEIEPMQ